MDMSQYLTKYAPNEHEIVSMKKSSNNTRKLVEHGFGTAHGIIFALYSEHFHNQTNK